MQTPATYVAAGGFEQAASLLNKQIGVVNFEPLRTRFNQVYGASKLYLPGMDELPAMKTYIRHDNDEDNPRNLNQLFLDMIIGRIIIFRFQKFKANNLEEAITTFRKVIYTITVLNVDDEDEETKCHEILRLCREYILGLSIELERRKLPSLDVKRNLELAAYFTRAQLQPSHKLNALQVAMTQSFKNKNYASASYFAEELLKISNNSGPRAEQAMKLKNKADTIANDTIEINFDPLLNLIFVVVVLHQFIKVNHLLKKRWLATYKPLGKLCKVLILLLLPASGLRIKG